MTSFSPIHGLSFFRVETGILDAADPAARHGLSADSGSFMGGGGRSSLLGDIFPHGNVPTDASVVQAAATRHGVVDSLRQGTVYVQVQNVAGASMPRLNTLSLLPARPEDVFKAVLLLDQWSEWMPRNLLSRSKPAGPGAFYHEAKVDAGVGGTFHYRCRLTHGAVNGGFQIGWEITPDSKIDPERGHKGLRRNSGSWTFAPAADNPDETLMAYQILVEPDVNRLLLGAVKGILTGITLGEFDQVILAMANRALDPSWNKRSAANPSGKNYRIQRTS